MGLSSFNRMREQQAKERDKQNQGKVEIRVPEVAKRSTKLKKEAE